MANPFGRSAQDIGKRIRQAREALGMTQEEFAAAVGTRQGTVGGWETGERPPGLKAGHRICDAYGLTLDYIFRGDRSAISQALLSKLMKLPRDHD